MTTRGYHGCMAIACKSGARKTVPLDLKIWSSLAEGHKGENEEVLDAMRAVDRATDGRGIRVYACTLFSKFIWPPSQKQVPHP